MKPSNEELSEYQEYVQTRRDAGHDDGEHSFEMWMLERHQVDTADQPAFVRRLRAAIKGNAS